MSRKSTFIRRPPCAATSADRFRPRYAGTPGPVHAEPVGGGAPVDEGLGGLVADTRPLVSPHVHGLANRLEDLAGLLAEHEAQHEAGGPPKDRLSPRSCVSDPASYTAVLPIGERTVAF